MGISVLLGTLIGPITELLKEVIPDADKRDSLAHEIATQAVRAAEDNAIAQLEVNKEEAKHLQVFVAGWRPFIGWVCGSAMAFNYMVVPLIGVIWEVKVDVLDITTMFPVLIGMLGLAGLRTGEKIKGVAGSGIPTKGK